MNDFVFPKAAMNTVYAPWWKLRLAKLFGVRVEGYDSGYRVVAYKWRGIMYLTECSDVEEQNSE